jgi:hypothetical protein
MKSSMQYISTIITLLSITSQSLAQQNTYPPTSSTTSIVSDLLHHTVAPTGSVVRVPRPTLVPGTTYPPSSEAEFTTVDMQVVEVGGSPVPTVVGGGTNMEGYVPVEESVEDAEEKAETFGVESGGQVESGVAQAPAPVTNNGGLRMGGFLETCALGVMAWWGML